ncbi:metal ABC transporter ATP-binding protein [bacterium]|nr:metal ABC transporter ATP-binding protein [bacterium]
MNSEIAIFLDHVWVKYDHRIVLENISLKVSSREIVSIVGPNGGGKTTLLNTILGFKEPFKGKVSVFGVRPQDIEKNGMIGYLPQTSPHDIQFPVRVFDVVAMSRYGRKSFLGRLNGEDRDLIVDSLKKVEMADFQSHHFGSLSGGQKQRVLIARALALRPKILILDEPSTGLDSVAQDQFYQILQKLRVDEKLTILMVSHDIGVVSGIVDQIACLNKQIHFHGNPKEGIPSEALIEVFGRNVQFVLHDKNCETCEKGL